MSITLIASTTPLIVPLVSAFMLTPLARFLRWGVSGNGSVTFRITAATYAQGA
jgi:hypothetical protein